MSLTKSTAGQIFSRDGFTFRPVAVPSRGSKELAVWMLEVAPGSRSEPHSVDREEVFVVVSGELTAEQAGERFTATAGDALILNSDVDFFLQNRGAAPAIATAITSAGMKAKIGERLMSPPWSL